MFFIHLCLWFQSVRCSPPWPLLLSASFGHAHRYFFKFFCTQENSFPFPFVLKWCVFISLLHLPLYKLPFRTMDEQFTARSVLFTRYVTSHFPSLRFVSASPESLAVFLCFYQVPILHRDGYRCVQGESPSQLGHFLPHCELGGIFRCCSTEKPDGTARR